MTARRSYVAVRLQKKVFASGSVTNFPNFVIGMVRGPLKILKTKVWVRVRNANNSTVLDFDFRFFLSSVVIFFIFLLGFKVNFFKFRVNFFKFKV